MSPKKTQEDLVKPLVRSRIKAKDIVQALTRNENGPVRLILRHKTILGNLDLKHRLITIPVTFKNCEFLGDVDLRNCEFEQAVNWTGCTFHRGFNSGGSGGSHTIYRKDLICYEATFEADVSFVGSNFESRASFAEATFQSSEKFVNFGGSSFKQNLLCYGATFKGPVNFSGIKCEGSGLFLPAEFDGEEGKSSRPVSFEKEAIFRFASFGETLECNEAIFHDQADFTEVKCGSNAIFDSAEFGGEEEKPLGFRRASIGGSLVFYGATFKGPVSFLGIKCEGSGLFLPAEFDGEEGKSSRPVSFENGASFRFATFGINLECAEATFKKKADFSSVRCGDYAIFASANFEAEEHTLEDEEQFVDFTRAHIGGALDCTETTFNGPVFFSNATLGILALGNSCRFAPETLDLRELTFNRFDGTPEQARHLVEVQNPAWFSRDPYMQLEQYYRSVGNDAQAKEIYYQGHQASRINAKKRNGSVEWSRGTNALDWLWKTLTRYGISTWRLLAIAIAFILLGTLIFYLPDLYLSQDALKLASDSANTASWEQGWLYRTAYSLDLFLPLVNLHIDEKWTPGTPLLQAYAILHSMIGWLIVPLLIAALAGIMRR